MIARTKVPEKLKALLRQRIRWMTGGIQIIVEEGINKYTFEDAFNHLLFITLFLVVVVDVVLQSVQRGWHLSFSSNPLPISLAILGYFFSVYNLHYVKNIDAIDIIIRLLIIPELIMAILLSGLQIYSYMLSILKKKQSR